MPLRRISWCPALVVGLFPGGVPAAERPVATLAHVKLSGSLEEAPVPSEPLFGQPAENFSMKLRRIQKARDDAQIDGLLLQLDGLQIGWGKLDELRRAVADFRKAGKKAFAYLESGETKDYLLATACDEVALAESASLMLVGLQGEVAFYKDLLDKVGIKADMLQMGTYKGAAEPMTRSSMSPAFRERLESVLDDYFEQNIVRTIADSRRGLTAASVRKLIDRGPFTARAARDAGLIDRVAYLGDFRDGLKTPLHAEAVKVRLNYARAKAEEIDLGNPFALFKLLKPAEPKASNKPKVAVIVATGTIVQGKSTEGLFDESTLGSTTLIEAVRQAEKDKTVKAIVLRVDSPGGSALASDLIWNELMRCKKPVVASMSDVAASGGYYISMAARKIYAEPGTLTGSIGVVGGKLVVGGLYEKLGVKTEVIRRGANAGIFSSDTPFSEPQRQAMATLMQDTYDQFLDKAIRARARAGKKFSRDDFIKLAEGRIWTGRQAKEHGLVDELGTLEDAVGAAKGMAGLGPEPVEWLVLPKARTLLDVLLESGSDAEAPGLAAPALAVLKQVPGGRNYVRALGGLLRLQGEPVWAVMPAQVTIR